MESKRELIYEAVKEVIKDKIINFLRRYCKCVEVEKRYSDILKLADKLDKIEDALRRKSELDLGIVKIKVRRGFFRSKVCIEHEGKSYCNDDVNVFLSKVRTILAYYNTDCDVDNIISDTILTNDFNLIDFVRANLSALKRVCEGEEPTLNMSMLEEYARDAVRKALEEYLSSTRGSSK